MKHVFMVLRLDKTSWTFCTPLSGQDPLSSQVRLKMSLCSSYQQGSGSDFSKFGFGSITLKKMLIRIHPARKMNIGSYNLREEKKTVTGPIF